MLLYLIRHGLANWPAWGGPDDERPLNPEGTQLIQAAGKTLARLGVKPELILHSPLHRARQTAELIAEACQSLDQLHESEQLRPGFNPVAFKVVLDQHNASASLMLIGHAPDMAMMTQFITGGATQFKEGTVACIKIEKPETDPRGVLLWLATTDLLRD